MVGSCGAYELTPEVVQEFIEAGKLTVARYIKFRSAQLNKTETDPVVLREAMSVTYEKGFIHFTRNNYKRLTVEQRRSLLQGAIKAAAGLWDVSERIRRSPDVDTTFRLLRNGKNRFYSNYSKGELHPKIIDWLDYVMSAAERAHRDKSLNALRTMFPTTTGPCKGRRKRLIQRGAVARLHSDQRPFG